jgi:hypothetical protein
MGSALKEKGCTVGIALVTPGDQNVFDHCNPWRYWRGPMEISCNSGTLLVETPGQVLFFVEKFHAICRKEMGAFQENQ